MPVVTELFVDSIENAFRREGVGRPSMFTTDVAIERAGELNLE